jgi:hypothetical protein
LSCESSSGKYAAADQAKLLGWVAESFTDGKYKIVLTTKDIMCIVFLAETLKQEGDLYPQYLRLIEFRQN